MSQIRVPDVRERHEFQDNADLAPCLCCYRAKEEKVLHIFIVVRAPGTRGSVDDVLVLEVMRSARRLG
jgi:hypothetical protein